MNHSLVFRTLLILPLFAPSFVLSRPVTKLPPLEDRKPSPEVRQETIYRVLNRLGINVDYVESHALDLLEKGEYGQAKNSCTELWDEVDTLKSSIKNDTTLTMDDVRYLLTRFEQVQKGIDKFVSSLPPSGSYVLDHLELKSLKPVQ